MKYGIKYRTLSCTNINAILKQFTYDLDLHIYKISSYNKPIAYFNQWRCLIIKELLKELKRNLLLLYRVIKLTFLNIFKFFKNSL